MTETISQNHGKYIKPKDLNLMKDNNIYKLTELAKSSFEMAANDKDY